MLPPLWYVFYLSGPIIGLGALEITQRARQFSASTFKFREGYFVSAFIYLCLTLGLSVLLGILERRMTRDRKGER